MHFEINPDVKNNTDFSRKALHRDGTEESWKGEVTQIE